MGTRVTVTINDSFFKTLGHSSEIEALTDAIADLAVTNAKAAAPRKEGDYVKSIKKITITTPVRKVKRIVAEDPKAAYLETRCNVLRAALRKARRA